MWNGVGGAWRYSSFRFRLLSEAYIPGWLSESALGTSRI
jgi:hypothetical protein